LARLGTDDVTKELVTDDLGMLPIIARIARRLSQRNLANLIEVSEQQIQRYESDRYARISLPRYKRILDILGVELQSRLKPSWSTSKTGEEVAQLELGLDSSLISEIRENNWLQLPKDISKDNAAQLLAMYISGGTELGQGRPRHRRKMRDDKNNSPLTETALAVWQSRVLQQAAIQRHKLRTRFNIVDTSWLKKLANLSRFPDGRLRAIEFLREHGIILVIVPHLSHTRLDGAAMLLADGTPVIALTLRYDRLDSFWFTLFHECAHICFISTNDLTRDLSMTWTLMSKMIAPKSETPICLRSRR
jgi:HTH-type transcriptional regulator / antitoxin HigA